MNGFEPTILGISVYIITIAEINEVSTRTSNCSNVGLYDY